jgi:hypothetical protein
MDQFKPIVAIRSSLRDYSENNFLYDIPLYGVGKIDEIICMLSL